VNGPVTPLPNTNGAVCPTDQPFCNTAESGAVNYLERQMGPNGYLSIRNGYLNDPEGQRTGHATLYSDHVLGYAHWSANQRILIRPEVGIYHAYNAPAFDNGNHKTLKIAAVDVVVTF
jgi:hypothetical protein